MMMQLTPTVKGMLFRPSKTATTLDAQPNTSPDQCKQLARAKLEEAVHAVPTSLVES